jgi:hypothetical protein
VRGRRLGHRTARPRRAQGTPLWLVWRGPGKPGAAKRQGWQGPHQFSCWNESDPNRRIIEAVTADDADFAEFLGIARLAAAGTLSDLTFGSCHYCTARLNPGWARGHTPVVQIGAHKFFNTIE